MFISHSSRDNAWAVAVKQWLVAQQPDLSEEIFLDIDPETGIHSGQRWKEALRAANERCEVVICLVSPNWLGSRECEVEYRTAENFGKRIYCARIEPVDKANDLTREWQRCDLYGDGPHTEVRVNLDSRTEAVLLRTAGLRQLLTGLREAGIGADHFSWPPAWDLDRAPYRGWDPFEPADAAVFFGRDGQVLQAMDTLREMRTKGTRPLFVIVGASGTGKSSFLRAGLIPRLGRDDRHFVVMDTLRPERDALTGSHGLASILCATRTRLGVPGLDLGDVKTALAEGKTAVLRQWLVEIQQTARDRLVEPAAIAPTVVLPIDQAEELLSADAGPQAARLLDLLGELLTASVDERLTLIVVMTVRTDRYEQLHNTPRLVDVDSVVFNDLKPMPHDRFGDIITGPARHCTHHLEIAPELVEQLLADCRDGADTLALLSLTLATLYRDYGAGERLTLDQYDKIGGIGNVIATEIDSILSRDPATRRRELELLRSAFIPFLATIAPDNDLPLRRIALWTELPAAAHPLLDRFVDRRLLVKNQRKSVGDSAETIVEVALESLLRQWEPLAEWLCEEAEDLRTAESIERAAAEWERKDRAEAWLSSGLRLATAETLTRRTGFRKRLAATRAYLRASRAHEGSRHADELREAKEHADALRTRARTLLVLAAVAVLVAVTAGVYYLRADTAEHRATSLFHSSLATLLVQDAARQFATGHDLRRAMLETLAAQALSPDTTAVALLDAQFRTHNVTKIVNLGHRPIDMTVSPDARRVIARDFQGAVRVWDLNTSNEPRTLTGTDNPAAAVAMSPDGRWVITGDSGGATRVWDLNTSNEPRTLTGTDNLSVVSAAVSPDGRWVITGDSGGATRVWDLNTSNEPRTLTDTGTGISSLRASVVMSPDGRWVITDHGDDRDAGVQVWDLNTSNEPRTLISPRTGTYGRGQRVASAAVSPDGRRVTTGHFDGTVRVWDMNLYTLPRTLTGTGNQPARVAMSPDGRWVTTGDDGGATRVWDLNTSNEPRTLTGTGTKSVASVEMSPDGRWVTTGDVGGAIRAWDLKSSTAPRTLTGTDNRPASSAAMNSILVPIDDGKAPESAAISSDGRWGIARDLDGAIRLWDLTLSTAPRTLTSTGNVPTQVEVSPDGRWVITGDDGSAIIRVWDMNTSPVPRTLTGTGTGDLSVMSTEVSPNGRWVITLDRGGTVRAWDLNLSTTPRILTNQSVTVVAMSPDGRWVITADSDGTVQVWDLNTSNEPRTLTGTDPLTRRVTSFAHVAMSPDGRWVITGESDGAVRVWDLNLSAAPRALAGTGNQPVMHVAASPDGRWVVTEDLRGAVRVWSTDPNQTGVALAAHNLGAVSPFARTLLELTASDPGVLCSKLTSTMTETEWNEWVTPDLPPARLCDGLKPLGGN